MIYRAVSSEQRDGHWCFEIKQRNPVSWQSWEPLEELTPEVKKITVFSLV